MQIAAETRLLEQEGGEQRWWWWSRWLWRKIEGNKMDGGRLRERERLALELEPSIKVNENTIFIWLTIVSVWWPSFVIRSSQIPRAIGTCQGQGWELLPSSWRQRVCSLRMSKRHCYGISAPFTGPFLWSLKVNRRLLDLIMRKEKYCVMITVN